ncbi:ATP synthase CF0 A subunit (plastid) [Cryptomonas paramecium]|uniref:ATP synthase subunit a, chloroplastic n=1 Tax=Cryptomonas paramaecium TaxID=2898 RepID=D2IS75_9CRYP|nr:ATP synthase CF0 A subunit [Cryptomonas paramecium]ACT46767.1 ATP synthase CF0 A subunit [Cryptomonas paramecium]BDA98028.1 ATP synthase CF0 A subunit [Cryptomonas paramecium]
MHEKKIAAATLFCKAHEIKVGNHIPWEIFGLHMNGETILTSLIVTVLIISFCLLTIKNPKYIPGKIQNFIEYIYEALEDISNNQIGKKDSEKWVPYISTLCIFIFVSNWIGILIPLKLIPVQGVELGSPTNDINTTTALALLTSASYFYAGLKKKGWRYYYGYFSPNPAIFPIKILEDFTKPLSLNFRLFGNILADELVVSVFCLLAPILIPLPVTALALFAGSIQALIFSTLSAAYISEAIENHKID